MSFGGNYGKDIGIYVNAVKNAIATMIAAIPEITIKDETNDFDDKEFKDEYEKIHRDIEKFKDPIIKALNGLPVYYRYHIKKGLVLGKGLKIVRYQTFIKKRNQALNQALKRKEKKRKELKKKEDDVEDELVNQFNDTMNISTKRRRVEDVY